MTTNLKNNHSCCLPIALDVIGGKWKVLILYFLDAHGTLRYSEIKKLVSGITGTMLAKSLKELEQYKLIERKQYNEMPLRVEYSIHQNSNKLLEIIMELNEWGLTIQKQLDDEDFDDEPTTH